MNSLVCLEVFLLLVEPGLYRVALKASFRGSLKNLCFFRKKSTQIDQYNIARIHIEDEMTIVSVLYGINLNSDGVLYRGQSKCG